MSSPALHVMVVHSLEVARQLVSEGWCMRSAYKTPDGTEILMTHLIEDYSTSSEESPE